MQGKKKAYFGKHIEEAITTFLNLEDKSQRKRLVASEIYPALNKLAENVMHNLKFYNYGSDSYLDMKHDCVCHLYEQLGKYDSTKGHKAFSYFNRCAINWVWGNMTKVGQETYGKVDIIEIDNFRNLEIEENSYNYNNELKDFCTKWSVWGHENLCYFYFFKAGKVIPFTERHSSIADAVFNLFEHSESIDIHYKKALYILIREQVDVKTQEITDVVNVLRPLCKSMFLDFKKNGTKYWHRHLYFPEEIQDDDNYIQQMFDDLQTNEEE